MQNHKDKELTKNHENDMLSQRLNKPTVSLQLPCDIGARFNQFQAIMAQKGTPDPQKLVFMNFKHFARNRRRKNSDNCLDQIFEHRIENLNENNYTMRNKNRSLYPKDLT